MRRPRGTTSMPRSSPVRTISRSTSSSSVSSSPAALLLEARDLLSKAAAVSSGQLLASITKLDMGLSNSLALAGNCRPRSNSLDKAPTTPQRHGTALDSHSELDISQKLDKQQQQIDRMLKMLVADANHRSRSPRGPNRRPSDSLAHPHRDFRSGTPHRNSVGDLVASDGKHRRSPPPRRLEKISSSEFELASPYQSFNRRRSSMIDKAIEANQEKATADSLHTVARRAKRARVESHMFMLSPKSSLRLTWDIGIIAPLLIYFAIMIPFRLCFVNDPICDTTMYWFEFTVEAIFIFDIFVNFRTGFFLESIGSSSNIEELQVEYDPGLAAHHYFKSWLALDVVSGIPFMLIDRATADWKCASSELEVSTELRILKSFRMLRFLKLARLIKFDRILKSLVVSQDMNDRIDDFFEEGMTRSALRMFWLIVQIGFICHLMACLWVMVGRNAKLEEHSWLSADPLGPFDSSETVSGENVGVIYLSAYYFCITAMTSVGFGDISANNNSERIFIILLEIIGGFVFGLIIASLTSVVTSMDMGDRRAQEERDAVASFVASRKFPRDIGRRIRRHFRQYYKLKSAIDEEKIFKEMSPLLRMEVSSYIVMVQMSDVKIFQTMDPLLWSNLLLLLRPIRFEIGDHVANQGEDCFEMYVVLKGDLAGESTLPDGTVKVRDIAVGDNINILCLLKVYDKCVENVEPLGSVDAYAISSEEFQDLFDFNNSADKDTFELMQDLEVKNFRMDRSPNALAKNPPFGVPLYVTFASVSFSLIKAEGLIPSDSLLSGRSSDSYALIELVHLKTQAFVNNKWRYVTDTHRRNLNPVFHEGTWWRDIFLPFDDLGIRVRLFDQDKYGTDDPLGEVVIPLTEIEARSSLAHKHTGRARAQHHWRQLRAGRELAVLRMKHAEEVDGKSSKSELDWSSSTTITGTSTFEARERHASADMNWKMLGQTLDMEKHDSNTEWYNLQPFGKLEKAGGRILLRTHSLRSEASHDVLPCVASQVK